MSVIWSAEELAVRFAPYINELQEFFAFHGFRSGSPEDLFAVAGRLKQPGTFVEELSSMLRSIILREGGSVPHTQLLEILAVSIGGSDLDPTAPEFQQPFRQLLAFVGEVTRRPWNEPPGNPAPPVEAPENPPEPNHPAPKPEKTERSKVVQFPSPAKPERRDPRLDHLPDEIYEDPAVLFANAMSARHASAVATQNKDKAEQVVAPAAESSTPAQKAEPAPMQVPAATHAPVPSVPSEAVAPVAAEHSQSTPAATIQAPVPDPVLIPELMLEEAAEPEDDIIETSLVNDELSAHARALAIVRRWWAHSMSPSFRNAFLVGATALILTTFLFAALRPHRTAQANSQPPLPSPQRAPAIVPKPAPAGPVQTAAAVHPTSKPPAGVPAPTSSSPAPVHHAQSEEIIAEPWSNMPPRPAGYYQPSASPATQPSQTAVLTQSSYTEGESHAGISQGAPTSFRGAGEQSFRSPTSGLASDAPRRNIAPLADHPSYLDVSSGLMAGNLISAPMPSYPMLAHVAHLHGEVIMQAVISKNGTVSAAHVLSGHRLLRAAAVDAVRQWRYRPYRVDGHPVEVSTIVTVKFLDKH